MALTNLVYNCIFGNEAGLFSVRDSNRSIRRKEFILEMLRNEPVIYESNSIFLVRFRYCHMISLSPELHNASHFWHSPPNSASVVTSPCQHRTTSSTKESCTDRLVAKASAHES